MYIGLVFDQLNSLELVKVGVCPVVLFDRTEAVFRKRNINPRMPKFATRTCC